MSFLSSNLALIAQATADNGGGEAWHNQTWFIVLTVLAIILVPLALAQFIASAVRMRDYTTKLYIILFAVTAGVFIVSTRQVQKDIDLNGGTELIYEVDKSKKIAGRDGEGIDMDRMIAALRRRVDPAGVKQVRIRAYGAEQVEITIPEVDPTEVSQLKRTISSAGILIFRILADPSKNSSLVAKARALPSYQMDVRDPPFEAKEGDPFADPLIEKAIELGEGQKSYRREQDGTIAEWVPITDGQRSELDTNKKWVTRDVSGETEILMIKDRLRARWIEIGLEDDLDNPGEKQLSITLDPNLNVTRQRPDGGYDALVVIDPMNVHGGYLTSARSAPPDGRSSGWAVEFKFNTVGAEKFGRLTAGNQPDEETGAPRFLGISLDDKLLSAPALRAVITSDGQITGNFTKERTQELSSVLNAGSLPAALSEEPIREQRKSPLLGKDTIEKGETAITISFFAVVIFMPLYYRFAGVVAVFALTLNLVLVMAIMMVLKARFSLPGMAGLVLTVGMAVDANVLIFERIREELNRGAALRMAIRNGFDRATRTIIDANVTTLITGLVLYVIGSEQIKGFAVTLILGILMSMFTAIFCSRVIFDIAEKRRWIKTLHMTRLFGETNFDFLSKRKLAGFCSMCLIVLGLVAVYDRGLDMLAIDFTGGSKLAAVAKENRPEEELKDKLIAASEAYAAEQRPTDLVTQKFSQPDGEESDPQSTFEISSEDFPRAAEKIALLAFPKAEVLENQGTGGYEVFLSESVSEDEIRKKIEEVNGEQGDYYQSLLLDPDDTRVTVTDEELNNDDDAAADAETKNNDAADGKPKESHLILYEIETKQPDLDVVRDTATRAWGNWLENNSLSYDPASLTTIETSATTSTDATAGPAEPATPEGPAEPATSETPAESTTPQTPAEAGESATEPAEPTTPEAPSDVETPAEPETPAQPEGSPEETTPAPGDSSRIEHAPESIVALQQTPVLAQPATEGEAAADGEGDSGDETVAEVTEEVAEDSPASADDPGESDSVETEIDMTDIFSGDPAAPEVAAVKFAGGTRADLKFDIALNQGTLHTYIEEVMQEISLVRDFDVTNDAVAADQTHRMKEWRLESGLDKEQTITLLNAVATKMQGEPVFPSANSIGSLVAGNQQGQAWGALIASLVFIVGYIWIRFQRVIYGLAAVVALVHDVLITLGMLALSGYVANIFFFREVLLIDQFKISLEILAAFLTIIGYSLNDTIVVFDRIREVRGKSPDLTAGMINKSINQTLSRTLLTSATTLIVVAILYVMGGAGIHGFAFALVTGVLVGTYSSIFVASPTLLWLSRSSLNVPEDVAADPYPAGAATT